MNSELGSTDSSGLNQTGTLQTNSSQNLAGSPTSLQNQSTSAINNPNAKISVPLTNAQALTPLTTDRSVATTSLAPLYIGGGLVLIFFISIIILAIKKGAKQPDPVK